jgi:hypothetical protein
LASARGRVDEAGARRRFAREAPADRQEEDADAEDRDGGDRDPQRPRQPVHRRHLVAARLSQGLGRRRHLVEGRRDTTAHQRDAAQRVAGVRQPVGQRGRRRVGLPAHARELHGAVLHDVPDPHPSDQPEHEQQVGEELAGTASGGVGVELHAVHPTSRAAGGRVRVLRSTWVRGRIRHRIRRGHDAGMTTPDTTQKNTGAFYLQAAASFGISLFAMMVAIYYLPADPWIKAFLALGTLFLTTSSFTLAKCIRDAVEDQMVVRRLDQARLDRALASHDPFKNAG